MKIEITKEQGQILINLLDVATKAGGLQVAEGCIFFTRLVQEAAKQEVAEIKPEEPAQAE